MRRLFVEKLVLKQQQIDNGNGDIGVGQVEDGAEEIVVAVDEELQPSGYAVPLKQREVEHVDHASHHEAGVMAAELGNGVGCRGREQQSVECAVEDVARGACEDQRQPDENAPGSLLAVAHQVNDQPCEGSGQTDAENSQQQFAPVESAARGNVHTESGAVVLDEAQLEPVGEYDDRFTELHVGFDPYLECLVGQQQQDDQERDFLEIHLFRFIGTKIVQGESNAKFI